MTACQRWIGPVLLGIVAATGAASCSLESGTAESEPGLGRIADEEHGFVETTLMDLPRNGLASAAITREALTAPGTQSVLHAIASGALTAPTTLSNANRAWLASDDALAGNARDLLKYIVSCALDPGVQGLPGVSYHNEPLTWLGELGLCDGQPGTPGNWMTGAPGEGCLQAVTACVLARVNAQSKRVIISMRGESTALLPLRPKVKAETKYRENNGTPIRSFDTCSTTSGNPVSRQDCGWQARHVGTCVPGSSVTLQTSSSAMVRICKGIYGCDYSTSGAGYDTPWYAGHIKSTTVATGGSLSFTCPQAPVLATARSYFSVMLASTIPNVSLSPNVDVTVINPISDQFMYPAPENKVFAYREGAFYGNIFDATAWLGPSALPLASPELLAGFQYACYSNAWTIDLARLSDRLCAGPTNPCFEHVPQPCQQRCLAQVNETGAYLNCHEEAPESRWWNHAITVYLNHPCDLARDTTSCQSRLNSQSP